jgi:ribosomal-protein-alanine N-acetyltransferase
VPSQIELRTARLLLRPPCPEDADAYVVLASDPDFAAYGSRRAPDREATVRALARIIATPWERRPEFAVLLAGQVIGRVSLDIDAVNQIAALGYGIARPHWGQGLASEAAGAMVDYAFNVLGLAKVWARVDPRNVASVRVLEKLGMQHEGTLRSHVLSWGERVDRASYGLLRPEWAARRDIQPT